MRARYMDPALGRFVSEDPAKDGANWYVYGGNNFINLVDVTGRCIDVGGAIILILILAILAEIFFSEEGPQPHVDPAEPPDAPKPFRSDPFMKWNYNSDEFEVVLNIIDDVKTHGNWMEKVAADDAEIDVCMAETGDV